MLKYGLTITLILLLGSCQRGGPQVEPLLSGSELAYTNTQVIKACYPKDSRPIMWLNGNQASGVSVETLRAVAKKVNLNIKFIDKESQEQVIAEFKLGNCDIATGIKEVPERIEFMDFTQPYLFVGATMLVRQLPINFPMRVGFGRKFGIESTMKKFGTQVSVVDFSSDREAFKELMANQISAIVIDDLTAHQLEKENGTKFSRVGVNFYYDIAFGYQKNNQLLGELLRKGLANLTVEEKLAIYKTEINR